MDAPLLLGVQGCNEARQAEPRSSVSPTPRTHTTSCCVLTPSVGYSVFRRRLLRRLPPARRILGGGQCPQPSSRLPRPSDGPAKPVNNQPGLRSMASTAAWADGTASP